MPNTPNPVTAAQKAWSNGETLDIKNMTQQDAQKAQAELKRLQENGGNKS